MSVATKRRTESRPAAPKVQRIEPKERKLTGLCVTCNHGAGCSYLRNSTQPVVFCEEFDCATAPVVEEARIEAPAPTDADMKLWDEYKGLCANCDVRETCAIRKPESGIWHCEEYR